MRSNRYLGKYTYDEMKDIFCSIVKDIETHQKEFHCYAYPKTIRSILSGSALSEMANHFKDKSYYKLHEGISLKAVIFCLEELVRNGDLSTIIVKDKRRYCSMNQKTIASNTKTEETTFTDEELAEIALLLE